MKEQVWRTDDADINHLHGSTKTHPEILVEQGYDDVGATGAAIVREYQSETGTSKSATYEHVHELILASGNDGILLEERLKKSHKQRHYRHSDDCSDGELSAQRLWCQYEHGKVEH